jgi:hypothetical protein
LLSDRQWAHLAEALEPDARDDETSDLNEFPSIVECICRVMDVDNCLHVMHLVELVVAQLRGGRFYAGCSMQAAEEEAGLPGERETVQPRPRECGENAHDPPDSHRMQSDDRYPDVM